jgi:hypothetical protein
MQFPGGERLAVVSAGQEVDDLLVEVQRALDRPSPSTTCYSPEPIRKVVVAGLGCAPA